MKDIPKIGKWFVDVVHDFEHIGRINDVIKIRHYFLRQHNILNRPDTEFKGEKFISAKLVLNTIRSIIDEHVAYCVGKPVTITGMEKADEVFSNVYKRGGYNRVDMEIAANLYKYGNAFEYPFIDAEGRITSHVIANEDAYPVYDDRDNYTHFIEYWKDIECDDYYTVYYPDHVEQYKNEILVDDKPNLTGLPIHYKALDKAAYSQYGDGIVLDLIPIMDAIEYLLSVMDDSIIRLSLNPLGVSKGKRIDDTIPKDIIGVILNMEDGDSDFKWASSVLDHQSISLMIDKLTQHLYAVAGVPALSYGQNNVANVSEVSLAYLYAQTDHKAKKTIQALREGMFKRFDYIRKLLVDNGIKLTDDEFYSLDINFNVDRPVDVNGLMNDLKTQKDMGAISTRTIIECSPYTTDTAAEMRRLDEEKQSIDKSQEITTKEGVK